MSKDLPELVKNPSLIVCFATYSGSTAMRMKPFLFRRENVVKQTCGLLVGGE
jgi:hypothetical protein